MPRNQAGVYSLPPDTAGVPNETIASAQYNAVRDDLVADANAPRPVTAGGTGAATATAARANLGVAKRADNATTFVAGEGVIVGQGGLFTDAPSTGATSFDDIVAGYAWNIPDVAAMTNAPAGATGSGLLIVKRQAAGRVAQELVMNTESASVRRRWTRSRTSPDWTSWVYDIDSGNTLGVVSQTSGAPTGATQERVIDGLTRLARFANGMQIVTRDDVTFNFLDANTLSYSWAFPKAFIGAPAVSMTLLNTTETTGVTYQDLGQVRSDLGTTTCVVMLSRAFGASVFETGDQVRDVRLVATGWWF